MYKFYMKKKKKQESLGKLKEIDWCLPNIEAHSIASINKAMWCQQINKKSRTQIIKSRIDSNLYCSLVYDKDSNYK